VPRTRGYGRRTVEQTRSVDVRDLRTAAYVGEASGNGSMPATSSFAQASNPSTGTTLPSLLMVRHSPSSGYPGISAGRGRTSYADVAEKCCSYLRRAVTPGDVGTAMA
jgi:hypothetical protein